MRSEEETEYVAPADVAPLAVRVRVLEGNAEPREVRLTDSECTIGSAQGSTIVVREAAVSRRHLSLRLSPDGVIAQDLGSRNGTLYQGQRIGSATLTLGSRLSLGPRVWIALDPDDADLNATPPSERTTYRGLLGVSLAMRQLFSKLERLERSLVTVLLTGESGTGKELVARALHEGSALRGQFVAINCAAIPQDLVASELFGHAKGAFTGAAGPRKGAFELADGGTLFLDEVGDMPLVVQPALLRALESGEIRPVGGDSAKECRVRVIAATNRDLEEGVAAGQFREDLFYRLAVVRLPLPSLSERSEDVAILARHFAGEAGLEALPPPVIEALKARSYPGNVRELRNVVQAYAALGTLPAPRVPPKNAGLEALIDVNRPYSDVKNDVVDELTRRYFEAMLDATGGNQAEAARRAGLDVTYLGRLLKRLAIRRRS